MNYGIRRYNQNTASTMSPRDIEILAFEQAIRHLRAAHDQKSRLHALNLNQKLWSAILRETGADNNGFPHGLRANLSKLALWATRYSINAMMHGVTLKPLVDVNEDILEGLRSPSAREAASTDVRSGDETGKKLLSV
ncbi:hypothetical protein J2D73_06100 [Acetobacter sacchari]|uniref:FlaF protein n=1 Tax=Acetobacter sacchari TaxID=2661687 RepID=A0ABS3LTY3_9PROT|nr:flagellar biosynthesis regulator FlaF [Acetobacter sacchari]MBO1359367.1 hypothetical protein [Acetobacter sacchari]